jgi:hypothetical protein
MVLRKKEGIGSEMRAGKEIAQDKKRKMVGWWDRPGRDGSDFLGGEGGGRSSTGFSFHPR